MESNNNEMDEDNSHESNETANQLMDSLIPLSQHIFVYLLLTSRQECNLSNHQLMLLGCLASIGIVTALFNALQSFQFHRNAEFLVADSNSSNEIQGQMSSTQNRVCSLEIAGDNEASSVAISNAPLDLIRRLVRHFISNVNENWYQEQIKLVDSCLCGHEFHRFVQDQLIAFLTNPNTAWNGQQLNRARISAFCHPLVQERHHSVRYRRSTMQFLLGFQRHVRSLERDDFSEILLKLISQAIASLLCSTRRQSAAYTLPDACPFAETIDYIHFAEWPHWTSSVEESDPDLTTPGQALLASRSQSHQNFGDTAGMQCVAMSAMAIRFHDLMLGSLINLSRTTLDAILHAGNDLYNVCVKVNRWQQYRYLNFDELEAGMEEFDRQGWPQFSRELGPDSWHRFALDVDEGFNYGYDGFLMIMNNKAVAVMRDRDHPTQLYLFDSHGSERFPEIRQSTDGIVANLNRLNHPAYMQRVNGLDELVMSLRFLFGEFNLCEIHMYKCRQ